MCTIYTFDKPFYDKYSSELERRIKTDFLRNSHGLSMVGLDAANPLADTMLKSFRPETILDTIRAFMEDNSDSSRIWLHQRAATSTAVHVGTMHGFTDRDGNIIMHNGILFRIPTELYSVDSFAIPDLMLTSTADALLASLLRLRENFANVFIIRPQQMGYSVVRCKSGSLYTDGMGNYSSLPVGTINEEVPAYYAEDYYL